MICTKIPTNFPRRERLVFLAITAEFGIGGQSADLGKAAPQGMMGLYCEDE
jgi:hypothetical protein